MSSEMLFCFCFLFFVVVVVFWDGWMDILFIDAQP